MAVLTEYHIAVTFESRPTTWRVTVTHPEDAIGHASFIDAFLDPVLTVALVKASQCIKTDAGLREISLQLSLLDHSKSNSR